jgi:hypothetical protein
MASLRAEQLDVPGVAGHWSAKDILIHVAFWEEQTVAKLGGQPTAHDQLGGADNEAEIHDINDTVYRRCRSRSAPEVATAFEASGLRLLEALSGLDEVVVMSKLEFIAENTYRHYPEHAAQISAWPAHVQTS